MVFFLVLNPDEKVEFHWSSHVAFLLTFDDHV